MATKKKGNGKGGKPLTKLQLARVRKRLQSEYTWEGVTYPNMLSETFVIRDSRVYCQACMKFVCKKRLAHHVHGLKKKPGVGTAHRKNVLEYEDGKCRQTDIVKVLARWDRRATPEGQTISNDGRVFRYELVEMALRADIAIAKLDSMLPYIQKWARRQGGSLRNLYDYVTPVHMSRVSEIMALMKRSFDEFGMIADATPTFAEAEACLSAPALLLS